MIDQGRAELDLQRSPGFSFLGIQGMISYHIIINTIVWSAIMGKTQSGFREIQHTADLALHVWSINLPGLFKKSVEGMYQLIGISSNSSSAISTESLVLEAIDNETLLVSFLSECLFLVFNKNQFAIPDLLEIDEGLLNCRMQVFPIKKINKEIKAVTFHNLHISHNKNGCQVNIVFDV